MADATFPPEPATGAPLDLLLTTKLHVPLPAPTRLRRPRLLELVSRGLRGPLTLVAAPAGWGKTTLLSGWCADAAGADRAVAWLSLEPGDNDPARFWTYLIAALQTTRPTLGAAAGALLRAPRRWGASSRPSSMTSLPWVSRRCSSSTTTT